MKKWHKEPLVHFLILGALIFFLFSFVKDEKSNVAGNKIVISTADMERLSVNSRKCITAKPLRWDSIATIRFSGEG
jgi:hypothetical protein